MEKNLKQLLLKDLSARLPYGVFCNMGLDYPLPLQRLFVDKLDGILLDFYEDGKDYQVYLSEVKPYLRSMSTMTEDEKREFEALGWRVDELDDNSPWAHNGDIDSIYKGLEWLRAHFFDYLGLIEKGLALEALEGMYNV